MLLRADVCACRKSLDVTIGRSAFESIPVTCRASLTYCMACSDVGRGPVVFECKHNPSVAGMTCQSVLLEGENGPCLFESTLAASKACVRQKGVSSEFVEGNEPRIFGSTLAAGFTNVGYNSGACHCMCSEPEVFGSRPTPSVASATYQRGSLDDATEPCVLKSTPTADTTSVGYNRGANPSTCIRPAAFEKASKTNIADVACLEEGAGAASVRAQRREALFEGKVFRDGKNNVCIASFPGKFLSEWDGLVALCEEEKLSTACILLPKNDPKQRYGRHCENPDTPGKCYCHVLTGKEMSWGCCWFQAWSENLLEAVALGLQLVVVFPPGQKGKGIVEWNDLPKLGNSLWNNDGLGGSQKAEVAWMIQRGFKFTAMDMHDVNREFGLANKAQGVHVF